VLQTRQGISTLYQFMSLSEEDKFSRQKTARGVPKSTTSSIVQIGTRDPQTGLYTILNPCGGEEVRVGEKIFSSAHTNGQVVRATRAGGSTLLQLDNINSRSQQEQTVFHNCPGYFNGQIFNCDEEAPKDLIWNLEGSAIRDGGTYILTPAESLKAGGISTDKVSRQTWKLTFEYRIFGGSPGFADGIGFTYSPITPVGGGTGELDIGDLGEGFAAVINTYNGQTLNNNQRPQLQIWDQAHRQDLSPFTPLATSGIASGLRSEQWQRCEINYNSDSGTITIVAAGVSVSAPKIVPVDYQLRLMASTGALFDFHQVRNIKFAGKSVRGRSQNA
jgi:Bacterial lectin